MSKVILILPRDERPTMICRVPTGPDQVCGQPFYRGEERLWRAHMVRCASENRDKVEEASPRTRLPFLEHPDPEWEAHQREVGRRMIREGRLVPKPNER